MSIGLKSIGLIAILTLAGLAGACGPSAPAQNPDDKAGAGPANTATTTAPDTSATPDTTPSATPTAAPAGTQGGAPSATPSAGVAAAGGPATSVPLQASKQLEELKKIGINIAKIPELSKLPLAQKKKVMPLMQKALGYTACTGCHVEGDFKTETRNMKISREMWRAYTTEMRDEKGGAVFCDTCHSGQVKVLARGDKEALKDFMEKEYEHKLTRADKKENECSTCHGDEMEMKIIERLRKIPLETKK
jgi:hypothetical protein